MSTLTSDDLKRAIGIHKHANVLDRIEWVEAIQGLTERERTVLVRDIIDLSHAMRKGQDDTQATTDSR